MRGAAIAAHVLRRDDPLALKHATYLFEGCSDVTARKGDVREAVNVGEDLATLLKQHDGTAHP